MSGAAGTTPRTRKRGGATAAVVPRAPSAPRLPSVPVLVRLRLARDLMDRCYADPTERFYGIEALLRDDSGNWFSLSQRSAQPSA